MAFDKDSRKGIAAVKLEQGRLADNAEAFNTATARPRRETLNDETFGEPETLTLRAGELDQLLRQVFGDGLHVQAKRNGDGLHSLTQIQFLENAFAYLISNPLSLVHHRTEVGIIGSQPGRDF